MVLLIFLIILLHDRRTFLPLANNSDSGLGTRIRPRSHSPENEARDGLEKNREEGGGIEREREREREKAKSNTGIRLV